MAVYSDIIDRLVGKRYRVKEWLGAGAFGSVYRASHEVHGTTFRDVALKLFTNKYVTPANVREVFNEALHLEQAQAPARSRGEPVHLVLVYDIGVLDDYHDLPYMAMEVINGGSLEGKIPLGVKTETAVRLMRQICAGLKLAHAKGICHRDLKPGNVLFTGSGLDSFLKIADFGLAIDREAAFRDGGAAGTISYIPPDTGGVADGRYDVYSLGVILLEFLFKENPLSSVLEKARNEGNDHAGPLAEGQRLLADLRHPVTGTSLIDLHTDLRNDPSIQQILRACLAFEPAGRYRDASVLDVALENWEKRLPPPAPPPPPPRSIEEEMADAERSLKAGDYDTARVRLTRAQALARTNDQKKRAALAFARLHEDEGQFEEGIEVIQRLIHGIDPDPKLFDRLAELCRLKHDFGAAEMWRDQATKLREQAKAPR
jgi:serine/threonine protein kinase